MRYLSLIFIISGFVQSAIAQQLWTNTAVGMTVSEIVALPPTAMAPDKSIAGSNGSEALLIMRPLELTQQEFTAVFFFVRGKLSTVRLEPSKEPTWGEAVASHGSLVISLRLKYGSEISISRDEKPPYPTLMHTWIQGNTRITAYAQGIGQKGVLNLIYNGNAKSDAGKL